MNQENVVGVGNIYANEALFLAKIHPAQPACELTYEQFERLVITTKSVLRKAIENGGTTLKDFQSADGQLGYFSQQLQVYNRHNSGCFVCGDQIERWVLNQRATYRCPTCQPRKSC